MKKLLLGAAALSILLLAVYTIMPAESRPQPAFAGAGASETFTAPNECPADTAKGAYHVQGYDKETGKVICGFTYFNECPYFAGAEAGTPECEKGKPTKEQLEPWQPEQTNPAQPQAAQCGGK